MSNNQPDKLVGSSYSYYPDVARTSWRQHEPGTVYELSVYEKETVAITFSIARAIAFLRNLILVAQPPSCASSLVPRYPPLEQSGDETRRARVPSCILRTAIKQKPNSTAHYEWL